MHHSLLSLALLFSQQHPLFPQVTAALCLIAAVLRTTLVAELGTTAALHVVTSVGELDHVPVWYNKSISLMLVFCQQHLFSSAQEQA